MITIINIDTQTRTPASDGTVRGILGPSERGTRVRVAIHDVPAGRTHQVAPSDRTEVIYVLAGQDAHLTHTVGGQARPHTLSRRSGVYLEPGEEAVITASG